MSVSANSPCASERFAVPPEPVLPLTVEQYHEMGRAGILVDGDRIELLEGWLVGGLPVKTAHVACHSGTRMPRPVPPRGVVLG